MDMTETPGLNHDTAARLLGITPGELTALVLGGIINRADKDIYSLPVLVRDYINHLKNPSKFWEQLRLAEYLDISERNLRDVLARLGMTNKSNTVDEIRIAYINHLREQAAGRATNGDLDLATERAGLAQQQRIRIELQNAVTRREYGPIESLEFGLSDVMARVSAKLDTIPGKLKLTSDKLTAADLDIVSSIIAGVRNEMAVWDIDWFGDKQDDDARVDAALDS